MSKIALFRKNAVFAEVNRVFGPLLSQNSPNSALNLQKGGRKRGLKSATFWLKTPLFGGPKWPKSTILGCFWHPKTAIFGVLGKVNGNYRVILRGPKIKVSEKVPKMVDFGVKSATFGAPSATFGGQIDLSGPEIDLSGPEIGL